MENKKILSEYNVWWVIVIPSRSTKKVNKVFEKAGFSTGINHLHKHFSDKERAIEFLDKGIKELKLDKGMSLTAYLLTDKQFGMSALRFY
jgi:hypothetical protein